MTIWNGLTSDGAVVPIQVDDQGRVIAVGSGPDSPLVVDGDYLRPRNADLGLGTASINLDATGGASFSGNVKIGNGLVGKGEPGAQINAGGLIASSRVEAQTEDAFYVQVAPDSSAQKTKVILFKTDGSASFGDVTSGPSVSLNAAYGVFVKPVPASDGGSGSDSLWQGYDVDLSTVSSKIAANGICEFGSQNTDSAAVSAKGVVVYGTTGQLVLQGSTLQNIGEQIIFNLFYGSSSKFYIDNGGSIGSSGGAVFAGNVKAPNINTFAVVLKAALVNSDTVEEIKTALNEALAALVPPDASTMPTPDA
jgi:hypothetical protein